MSSELRHAATLMAQRMRVFRRIAEQAGEMGSRVNLAPAELWEAKDQEALDAYESALLKINGAVALPME